MKLFNHVKSIFQNLKKCYYFIKKCFKNSISLSKIHLIVIDRVTFIKCTGENLWFVINSINRHGF